MAGRTHLCDTQNMNEHSDGDGSPKLCFVGGGKMGEALLGGLISKGWALPSELAVVEPSEERREQLVAALPGLQVVDQPGGADTVIAVKPQHVPAVLESIRGSGTKRVLSIAAGVTIAAMEDGLEAGVAVVRAMPNTPALVGEGAAAIAPGSHADDDDMAWAASILSSVGSVEVLDESLLDAVTGVSGSGPAYVFLVAEAMMAAGRDVGLPDDVADALTRRTLLGASRLLAESGEDPAVLRANVTSPGGTTAEGIRALEAADVRDAFAQAIRAATDRSIELGGG